MSTVQSTEIKQVDIGSLKNEHFELKPTGLVVYGQPSFEDWEKAGKTLKVMDRTVQWWLGDWLNYGEAAYGEKYSQAIERYDYEYGTLRNAVWIATQIPLSRRHDNLSFSHHQEVASLKPDEQDYWLEKAEKRGWSKRDLRKAIKEKYFPKEIIIQPENEKIAFIKDWLNCFFNHFDFREGFDQNSVDCEGCLKITDCKRLEKQVLEVLALREKYLAKGGKGNG